MSATYACLLLLSVGLLICGLPSRAPQHASEQKTCPASWIVSRRKTHTMIFAFCILEFVVFVAIVMAFHGSCYCHRQDAS